MVNVLMFLIGLTVGLELVVVSGRWALWEIIRSLGQVLAEQFLRDR